LALHREPQLALAASCQSIRIAPLRLALDDEGLAADRELIAGPRIGDSLARSSKVAVSAWIKLMIQDRKSQPSARYPNQEFRGRPSKTGLRTESRPGHAAPLQPGVARS
jgi:hypothetical protein